jgi:anti-sigma factor RsiW
MCPDRQILSLYLDGELPAPWKEKMESHLAQCPECRRQLESYRLVSASAAFADTEFARNETALMETARERVWRNLETRARFRRAGSGALSRGVSVWRRSISIPFPAVAAAAAVLLVATAVLWIRRPVEPGVFIPQMAVAPEEALTGPDFVPIADMNGVLQYLGSKNDGDVLILHLPESRSFMSSGEPAILKAADYSRRQP